MNLLELWDHSYLVFAALALVSLTAVAQYQSRKYPRGPSRLSAFKGMAMWPENTLKYRETWKRQFGSVYTLFLGRNKFVLMTDYDTIHDAFVQQADTCSSRPLNMEASFKDIAGKGFQSPHWKEQRKFALTVLREQGMGKIDMEFKILEEVGAFVKEIDQNGTTPINMEDYMHSAISNIICNLVLGSRFEYKDPVFKSLLEAILNQTGRLRKMGAIASIPVLTMLPGDIFGYHSFVAEGRAKMAFFLNAIRQHEETLDISCPRDFIDAYLIEKKTRELNGNVASFDDANCVASVVQLLVAGTDTTANTLLWAWLFMILHPDIQKRVQHEIDRCVGSRSPSLNDRPSMHFTEAVLAEVLRLGNTAVNTIPHKADSDVKIGGHFVPAGTTLVASLSDVHLDKSVYKSPHQFDPTRFLNSSGTFEKPKKLIPFGIGRRACPGESLARAELFLFFTSVLQRFNLSVPQGCTYTAEGKVGFVHKSLPYRVVLQRRIGLV